MNELNMDQGEHGYPRDQTAGGEHRVRARSPFQGRAVDEWDTASHLDELFSLFERPEWHSRAACAGMDPNLWFPARGEPLLEVRVVCATCPVKAECKAAGAKEVFGVWGGTSGRDRRRTRSIRVIAA